MFNQSRREFLGSLGAFALSLKYVEPQLILYNGNVITVNGRTSRAQAVAVADGRFTAVGTNAEIRPLATARTVKIDLGGRTVLPGFIDAHSHPAYSGLLHLREVDADLRSITESQAAIRKRGAETPPGQWVLAFKYDDTKTREGRPLTRHDLDVAAPNHPVRIYHRGGHTAYVNSLAMKLAGVSESTPDPAGGSFDRDASGRLTGKLKETATEPFDKLIPSTYTREERREGVKLITRMMTRTGVTSVTDT